MYFAQKSRNWCEFEKRWKRSGSPRNCWALKIPRPLILRTHRNCVTLWKCHNRLVSPLNGRRTAEKLSAFFCCQIVQNCKVGPQARKDRVLLWDYLQHLLYRIMRQVYGTLLKRSGVSLNGNGRANPGTLR